MEEDGEPEQLEGGVEQLARLELDGVAEGDTEEDQVKEEVDGEDGQDVELVSGVLVVQEVPWLTIGQPELVAEVQALYNITIPLTENALFVLFSYFR